MIREGDSIPVKIPLQSPFRLYSPPFALIIITDSVIRNSAVRTIEFASDTGVRSHFTFTGKAIHMNNNEQETSFLSDGYEIEGLLNIKSKDFGVVITHPHPLYGGDMNNQVVKSIALAYSEKGYSTLRFNFRGVGKSGGNYDGGKGEKNDVLAAISCLADKGVGHIDLAGYSFGAWVNAGVNCENIRKMVMVSPPAALMDFNPVIEIPCLDLVITGERDDIAPADAVKKLIQLWNPSADFVTIPGADHFYGFYLKKLGSILNSGIPQS